MKRLLLSIFFKRMGYNMISKLLNVSKIVITMVVLIILILSVVLLTASPVLADRYYCFSTDSAGHAVGNDSNTAYGSASCSSDTHWYRTVERANDLIANDLTEPLTENIYILFEQGDEWDWISQDNSPDFENGSLSEEDDFFNITAFNDTATDCTYRLIIGAADSSGNYLSTDQTIKANFDWNDNEVQCGGGSQRADCCAFSIGGSTSAGDEAMNCITVENIYFHDVDSQTLCMFGDGVTWPGYQASGYIARWTKHYDTASQAILFHRVTEFEIYENHIDDTVHILDDYCDELGGTSLYVSKYSSCGKVYRNTIVDSWGEAIGAFDNLNDGAHSPSTLCPILIEDNYIINNKSQSNHPTGSSTISRWNMMGMADYGDDGVEPQWRGGTMPNCTDAAASGMSHESLEEGETATHYWAVYGNMAWGDERWGGPVSFRNDDATEDTVYGRIKYNIGIDNNWGHYNYTSQSDESGNTEIMYNVGGRYDDTESYRYCNSTASNTGVTWDYNHWEAQPGIANCRGTNDFSYADPDLETTTGYRWPTAQPDTHDEQETDSITFKDFRPKSTSPLIDKGGNYTTVAAADSGSGTSLVVAWSFYFYEGDKIAVNTPTNIATISSIDYSTDTLTLAAGISRSEDDDVWILPYDFGNRQQRTDAAYYGSAPDLGPIEFAADLAPSLTAPADESQQDPTGIITLTLTRNAQANHGASHENTDWEVSTDPTFLTTDWTAYDQTGAARTSVNIPAYTLSNDETYYWQARTNNDDATYDDIDSDWTGRSFTTSYDDTAPTIGSRPYTTNEEIDGSVAYTITFNGAGTHYATHWKVVLQESDCTDGEAVGDTPNESTCDTTNKTSWNAGSTGSYSDIDYLTSYKLCVWTFEDLDAGTDCDENERSAVAIKSFQTKAGVCSPGQHEGGDNSDDLYDSDAGWSVNQYQGYTVTNTNDSTSCTVDAHTTNTMPCTVPGTIDWDKCDAYIISVTPGAHEGGNDVPALYDTDPSPAWTSDSIKGYELVNTSDSNSWCVVTTNTADTATCTLQAADGTCDTENCSWYTNDGYTLTDYPSTHDGADGAATLRDLNAGWSVDQYNDGYYVTNTTNGESCDIEDTTPTTIVCTLSGGESWDYKDGYSIEASPGGYGIIVSEADLGVDGVGTPPYDHYGIFVSEADLGTDGTNHYGLTVSQ
jgi:hypothetical protein